MSEKRKRAPKDPNRPKRGLSAYMFFTQAVRAEVTAALGDAASIGTIGKEMGKRWGELSDKAKKPYAAKAAKDKKRYEKAKAKYEKAVNPPAKKEVKKDAKKDAKKDKKK